MHNGTYRNIKVNIFRSVIMFEKLVKSKPLMRIITAVLIGCAVILTLSVFSKSKDGRRQIIDMDGGAEERLCSILSNVKGAGKVEAMIEYDTGGKVSGVLVTAEGAGNPVVAKDLTEGVACLYNIPVSSVIVFEKEQAE